LKNCRMRENPRQGSKSALSRRIRSFRAEVTAYYWPDRLSGQFFSIRLR
jgi:hypothetical protein